MISTPKQKKSLNKAPQKKEPAVVVRALGLTSGGLDSILSALVLKEQGIEVAWVNFETPFFSADRARRAALATGIPLTVKNITTAYIEMLRDPHCGYGTNMNPCLDCHALMLKTAGSMMKREGFHFLFTGEVLGQRPMSQTKPSLRYVEKASGFQGHILRPLSAKLLPLTIPEERRLVDRKRLLDISGRSRKPQMKLAEAFGVDGYPAPAGGCLLTDPGFSRRVKDLLEHQEDLAQRDFELLKFGRHFRLQHDDKVIVGRTKEDNTQILKLADSEKDVHLRMLDVPGPIALIPSGACDETIREAAALCASYSKVKRGQPARISVHQAGGPQILTILAESQQKFRPLLI